MSAREYLIIGLGRFGSSLALKLDELNYDILAVDSDPKVVQELSPRLPQVITADCTALETLSALGPEAFSTVVVCVGADFESSILITNALKHDFGVKHLIAKAVSFRQRDVLLRVGADQVVLPEHESGVRLALALTSEGVIVDRLELDAGVSVSSMACPASLIGRSARQVDLRSKHNVNLLMIKGARRIPHPSPDEIFQSGDVLVVMGPDDDVNRLAQDGR
jgi:trk system potassium uptake protein TrkA